MEKLEWCGYQTMKKFDGKNLAVLVEYWRTDGQTDILGQHSPRYE